MKRKIVSCLLVASLCFSTGCYSTAVVSKDELKATGDQIDITVYTNGSELTTKDERAITTADMNEPLRYEFPQGFYHVRGDTLIGLVPQRRDLYSEGRSDSSRTVNISFAKISSIETERFSLGLTIAAIAIPLALAGGFLLWFGYEMSKV